ncbi:hypothetical protein [Streptomyces sp. NPDC055099]
MPMLLRLACIAVTHAFTALRLISMNDHDKDVEILALRHQLAVLHCRLGNQRPGLQAADRASLAALLAPLPRTALPGYGSSSPRTLPSAGSATS